MNEAYRTTGFLREREKSSSQKREKMNCKLTSRHSRVLRTKSVIPKAMGLAAPRQVLLCRVFALYGGEVRIHTFSSKERPRFWPQLGFWRTASARSGGRFCLHAGQQ
jgi:hypothetical protein